MLRDLRDLAFDVSSLFDMLVLAFLHASSVQADFHAKFNSQNSECMESAAGVVAKAFSNCMTDRCVSQATHPSFDSLI